MIKLSNNIPAGQVSLLAAAEHWQQYVCPKCEVAGTRGRFIVYHGQLAVYVVCVSCQEASRVMVEVG